MAIGSGDDGRSRRRRGSRSRRAAAHALPILLVIAVACDNGPTDEGDVGPETWIMVLEQVDDGTPGQPQLRRRGTIHLTLRLDSTTTPDPTCEDTDHPDITTFLAEVEVHGSRLQSPTGGYADGSWNCHGLAADVRLDDGTTYHLVSDSVFNPYREYQHIPEQRWTAGARRGHFYFHARRRNERAFFDTHVDIAIQNNTGGEIDAGVGSIAGRRVWRYFYDLSYTFADALGEPALYITVPPSTTGHASWPSFESMASLDGTIRYRVGARPSGSSERPTMISCFLAANHANRLDIIVHEGGRLPSPRSSGCWQRSRPRRRAPRRPTASPPRCRSGRSARPARSR